LLNPKKERLIMIKKIIRVFITVCLLLSISITTAFGAATDVVSNPITTATKSSSHIKNKTFNYSIYENGEFVLGVKTKVRAFYEGSSTVNFKSYITDVDVEFYGPLAAECKESTKFTFPVAVTFISTNESKPLAMLGYLVDQKGNIKDSIERYVK
jgi:hypothetical protein